MNIVAKWERSTFNKVYWGWVILCSIVQQVAFFTNHPGVGYLMLLISAFGWVSLLALRGQK